MCNVTTNSRIWKFDWLVWGRWFLVDPVTRTLSPFSNVRASEKQAFFPLHFLASPIGRNEQINSETNDAYENMHLLWT